MDREVQVEVADSGERLDKFLAAKLPEFSRSFAQHLIQSGHVEVAGLIRKQNYRLSTGEVVTVHVPAPKPPETRPENIPLNIIHEDDSLIIVNKPAGMVVHPAPGHVGGTLVNAVLGHTPTLLIGNAERPGIVHRLDRDTSGLIVIAKDEAALKILQRQFAARQVRKLYLALVHGRVAVPLGKIDAPLARDARHRKRMAVVASESAREAITVFRVAQQLEKYSLLQVEPQTGRTHQIRVHLAFINHPVVGDQVYGGRAEKEFGLKRQFLHAWRIEFLHPGSGERVQYTAPLSDDLVQALRLAGGDPTAWS